MPDMFEFNLAFNNSEHNTLMFKLHPTLEKDCIVLGSFTLSRVLLMNDSQYPWLILVPQIENVAEIYQLSEPDQRQLLKESCFLSQQLSKITQADKINIAALGNTVPQLHLHHIARFKHDPCWPKPIWGQGPAIPYAPAALNDLKSTLLQCFERNCISPVIFTA